MQFNAVPANLRVPFVAVEFDSSQAVTGLQVQPYRGLLVGQRLTSGTIPLESGLKSTKPTLVSNANDAGIFFGIGSIAHRMAIAWFNQNKTTECWMCGVADGTGGSPAAATYTVTLTGTATAAGTLYLYLGGERIECGVASGAAAAAVAPLLVAAINAVVGLPVVASNVSNVVTLTHRNSGTCGNNYDVRLNYNRGEMTPAGISVAIATGVAGAVDPTLVDTLSLLGDVWYNTWAIGWRNAAVLTELNTEFDLRFGPMRPIDGHYFFGYRDTYANLVSAGAAMNSKHGVFLGRYQCASMEQEYSAALAAVVALAAQNDPGRPFQTLPLVGLKGPNTIDDFDVTEQNALLDNGISTCTNESGVETLGRLITTYQRNALGADDAAFSDLFTCTLLSYVRYSIRQLFALEYPRHKLADDGTRFGPGLPIATPKSIRMRLIAWFRELEAQGFVEDFEQFKNDLVVEKSATNPNRVDVLLPVNLINALIVRAVQVQFRL